MPTRPRIDIAGYHHIINRGVDRMNIFRHSEDKDSFLQIVNKTAMIHKVIVHDYCLMDNHYHLLNNYTPAVQSPLLLFLIIIEIADLDNPRKEAISIWEYPSSA